MTQNLAQGLSIVLPPIVAGELPAVGERRAIQVPAIVNLVSQPAREIKTPVVLSGLIVRGPLNVKYTKMLTDFSIAGSIFESDVDLLFATFGEMISFERSEFRGKLVMKNAGVKGDLQISGAAFRGELEAGQLTVRNSVSAEGASLAVAAFDSLQVDPSMAYLPCLTDPLGSSARIFRDKPFFPARSSPPKPDSISSKSTGCVL